MVGLQFTYARRVNILNRSSYPVSEIKAVPITLMRSLPHCDVSMIRHHPLYSWGMSLSADGIIFSFERGSPLLKVWMNGGEIANY